VRFLLSVEISTIKKRGERTYKVHHGIYAPDFERADAIRARLSRVGNLASDGRPILGLDPRDLLEVVLESGPEPYLVPAHVWTPWFAALGSKSGFDSIDECYGDLAEHVFAIETGLSADPEMIRTVRALDRFRLVSTSDAHSPEKLGREATAFDGERSFDGIRRALETGDGYQGTVEFFPEEGKYHLDGHRKCEVRYRPEETRASGGLCPVCGRSLTVGVMHRVAELARKSAATSDGASDAKPRPGTKAAGRGPSKEPPTSTPRVAPSHEGEFTSLVPLPEVLGELHGIGPRTKGVRRSYDDLLAKLGPELPLLAAVPLDDVARETSSLVVEALARLRRGDVIRDAGYDGEYGTIRLFRDDELPRQERRGTRALT
jgi:DNA helicase-2/ATP-dependent DNA helicase PcrA